MSSVSNSKIQSAATSRSNYEAASQHDSSQASIDSKNIWQHPYVDVFKHFKLTPNQDWKLNKKQGDVTEIFAKEIGRKALFLNGTISANNFVQIPHPSSGIRTLGLNGRYIYLQVKAPVSSSPFSYHIDLNLAERSHGIRISASNLYKTISTQNGFALQVPLNLDLNRWSVVVLDIQELLKVSGLLPVSYNISGSYQIKSIMICACSVVRGIYTSDNLYDFVTLPPDMRFKFSFQISKWPEQFAWLELPQEYKSNQTESELALQRIEQTKARAALVSQNQGNATSNRQKEKMETEIQEMLNQRRFVKPDEKNIESKKVFNQKKLEESLNAKAYCGNDLLTPDELLGFNQSAPAAVMNNESISRKKDVPYHTGQYVGAELNRSSKLNLDPIMELKHVIGYSPDKCLNLKWSRVAGENIILFTSGGTLIAMDVETNEQKRFFFGHSSPICCFDVSSNGSMIASAQEGKNSIIRIWDYYTARCISMLTMPVMSLKCVAFSPDGRYLASVGKDSHNKELITIWDIQKISKGEKPEIAAKQTSDFNIICLKFSPIDNSRLVSCGKENIRFWRVKETNNIRGSAVVLNHHARNTVFTSLDFEWGARASANYGALNPVSRENESLKRIYVASKHGMVFQINYATEALEATYRTNETAIYTIAVNEAFCVTGSEDQFLRVWPLDFSEFFMEAKHEGTVCQVEISTDGLRVICGTLYGSLGILDKSNQRYKTLIRSHTNSIVSLDFHVPKRNIITVSKDNTIRLWDTENFDQAIEFSSPIDQPLCVSAHPSLPIFSCGFQSGTMRVFDIEKTCLADEFTQFNKPLRKICYSPDGKILVTCCEDGSVALHNAYRQHLPTKMMHLEFPPKYIHVAFSPIIRTTKVFNRQDPSSQESESQENENYDFQHEDDNRNYSGVDASLTQHTSDQRITTESFFGIMGEYGNNMMVYDSNSIILKHQIQGGFTLKSFEFNKNGSEVILITADLKIKFFALSKFEGVYLREVATVHRGSINSTDLSLNGGFMLTGGDDNLIKIWDYDAQKTVPYYFQAFIGHTYPITEIIFNPCDNNQIISVADQDGIYIWEFHGDTQTNYFPEVEQDDQDQVNQVQNDRNVLYQPTVLEKMRMSVKDKKKPKLAEFSFIVPPFAAVNKIQQDQNKVTTGDQGSDKNNQQLQIYYQQQVLEKELNFNHFISVQEKAYFNVEIDKTLLMEDQNEGKIIDPIIINGYDGFSGVHDNLLWNPSKGMIVYTLNNKVIKENTKTRQQFVFAESTVRLSCLAQSPDFKIVAAGEGERNLQNEQGNSFIYLFDIERNKLKSTLTFHQKGVQSLAFLEQGKTLVSIGVAEENTLVIWDIEQGLVLNSVLIQSHSTNKIIVDPLQLEGIEFATVGSKGHFNFWRYDQENGDIQFAMVDLPEHLQKTDFVTGCYSNQVNNFEEKKIIILGGNDGSIVVFDTVNQEFEQQGHKMHLIQGQIGTIIVRNNSIVLSSSNGTIVKYPIKGASIAPPDDQNQIVILKAESTITALIMDELNCEGILGTSLGNIFYLNFQEKVLIRLVSSVNSVPDQISCIKLDQTNQQVFLVNSGKQSGDVKLYTTQTIDQVMNFNQDPFGPVSFICGTQKNRKTKLIGHSYGALKFIALDSLKVESIYQIDLQEGEKLITGQYCPNGVNFAIGTSFGTLYFISVKKDTYGHDIMKSAKLSGLSLNQNNAVTCIQISNFDPFGTLTVAFDNGQVRTWQVTQYNEPEKQQKKIKQKNHDIADFTELQFNIQDKFDMFKNPHGLEKVTQADEEELAELYNVSFNKVSFLQGIISPECGVSFAPGNDGRNHYFSYVSALQYLFLRNYEQQQTVKRISLMFFPTCIEILDYRQVLKSLIDVQLKSGSLQVLISVGTSEGRVLTLSCDTNEHKMISKTKSGVIFGAVAGLSLSENGQTMIVSSESGEIMSFDLSLAIKERAL